MSTLGRKIASVSAASLAARAALCLCLLLAAGAASAGNMSAWQQGMASRARLVAATVPVDGGDEVFAGIEIQLDEGFKTYWRAPGDSGIPPGFDWKGSGNLASAEVLFPAPKRYEDPSGNSIGYKRQVLFPVKLKPAKPGLPISLKVTVQYAVCGELCIPAEAKLELKLPAGLAGVKAAAQDIARSLSRVPRNGADKGALPRVRDVSVDKDAAGRQLKIVVEQPKGASHPDLFVEGPREWYLPMTKAVMRTENGTSDELVYKVSLSEVPETAPLAGTRLRLTAVNAESAAEQTWTLK